MPDGQEPGGPAVFAHAGVATGQAGVSGPDDDQLDGDEELSDGVDR